MKNIYIGLTIATTVIVCMQVIYAESDMETATPVEPPYEQVEQEPRAETTPDTKPLKEFTPSEEISIDKPVAFPVDI